MADGDLIELRVYDLLLAQLQDFVEGLSLDVIPREEFPEGLRVAIPNNHLSVQDDIYLRVNQIPADVLGPCLDDAREFRGTLLVNVVAKRNKGIRAAMKLASCLVEYFYQGLIFFDEDVDPPLKIKIDRQTNIRPILYETDEAILPVTIKYRSFY